MQSLINNQGGQASAGLNKTKANTDMLYNNMNQNYGASAGSNLNDYAGLMNSYRSFLGGGNPSGGAPANINRPMNTGAATGQVNSSGALEGQLNPGLGGGNYAGATQAGPTSFSGDT